MALSIGPNRGGRSADAAGVDRVREVDQGERPRLLARESLRLGDEGEKRARSGIDGHPLRGVLAQGDLAPRLDDDVVDERGDAVERGGCCGAALDREAGSVGALRR